MEIRISQEVISLYEKLRKSKSSEEWAQLGISIASSVLVELDKIYARNEALSFFMDVREEGDRPGHSYLVGSVPLFRLAFGYLFLLMRFISMATCRHLDFSSCCAFWSCRALR